MANVQVRVDDAMKTAVDQLYASLGMDTSTAIRMFFAASLACDGLPFPARRPRPNQETLDALREASQIMSGAAQAKTYPSAAALFDDVLSEADDA